MILGLLFLVAVVIYAIREIRALRRPGNLRAVTKSEKPAALKDLEEYANRLYTQKQYLAAEKAYLKVLKLNHRDALAYNRLGLIYIALKNYDDAVESFQVAAQLNPTAASWYNLGQAFNENGNSIKAIAAIEKSIMFEPTAMRYLGLAKAYAKTSNQPKYIWSLEQAVHLEPSKKTLQMLADAYSRGHEREKMLETYHKILEIDPSDAKAKRIIGNEATSAG